MYLNFICRVDRVNSGVDGERQYILSTISSDCHSAFDEEQKALAELAQVKSHVEFLSPQKSLQSIDLHRERLKNLIEQQLFDEKKGGVKLWLPDGPSGTMYVTALSGTDGLGDIAKLADTALGSAHLYLQFSVYVVFSKYADNDRMMRPVTFEQFCDGVCQYVPHLPEVGLVRRHSA